MYIIGDQHPSHTADQWSAIVGYIRASNSEAGFRK